MLRCSILNWWHPNIESRGCPGCLQKGRRRCRRVGGRLPLLAVGLFLCLSASPSITLCLSGWAVELVFLFRIGLPLGSELLATRGRFGCALDAWGCITRVWLDSICTEGCGGT